VRKFYFAFFSVLLFAAVAAAAPADQSQKQDMGHGTHMGSFGIGNPDRVLSLVDELKLTNDQIKQLHDLKSSFEKDAVKIKAEIDLVAIDIKDEMRKDDPDKSKVDALAEKLSAAGSKMLKLRLSNMLETKKILTKEQFEKLLTIMETDDKQRKWDTKQK